MAIERARTLVIKKIDFKDSDYIVTLFGRDSGKFAGIAKGARKAESKFGGTFDLLNYAEVVYYQGSGLNFFSEAELINGWEGLKTDPEAINAGLRSALAIDRTIEEGGVERNVFDLFHTTLASLNANQEKVRVLELGFYLKLYRLLGYGPELDRCVECGKSLENKASTGFSPELGGVVCSECDSNQFTKISGGLRKKLLRLRSLSQDQVRRLKVSESQLKMSFTLLGRFGRYHFDRALVPEDLMSGEYL